MTDSRRLDLVVFVVLLVGCAPTDAARTRALPAPDTVVTAADVQTLARFEEATSLSVDPAGRLYVTDAGADVVVHLARDGTEKARYGGPGVQPGTFDDPADLDPTNGLALYVADAGNGRVQRFARAFQFLEAIPVGRSGANELGPTYDRQGGDVAAQGRGAPVAIAVSDADELFVIDAAAAHVVRWGPRRREPRSIGGFNAGPGALEDPVALAIGPEEHLFVADRRRDAVLVFGAFGQSLTTIAEGLARDARALRFIDGTLWLIGAEAVQRMDPTGRLGRRWAVRLDGPLVDADRHAGHTYFLTSDRLVRWTDAGRE